MLKAKPTGCAPQNTPHSTAVINLVRERSSSEEGVLPGGEDHEVFTIRNSTALFKIFVLVLLRANLLEVFRGDVKN